MKQTSLRPQDVLVLLKLITYADRRPAIAQVALELSISPSEVHSALTRLTAARLLTDSKIGGRPSLAAAEEFLLHGVKYAFPAQRGEITRGMPTSHAAPPLVSQFVPDNDLPPVWPYSEGTTRGVAIVPLYPTAPIAASRDPRLYELLVLVDAVREGRARDRRLAEQELSKRLRVPDHA
jgi:hypothetical protein